MDLYLASTSPRRKELLEQVKIRFALLQIDVDESQQAGELAEEYVTRLALAKAQAGWSDPHRELDKPVLGADTAVVIAGEILGKPEDQAAGEAMLAKLSGKTHEVYTGLAIVQDAKLSLRLSITEVTFETLSAEQISAYWQAEQPLDKAGSYGVHGLAGSFIKKISGSYTGVMGLPLYETTELLKEFGLDTLKSERRA